MRVSRRLLAPSASLSPDRNRNGLRSPLVRTQKSFESGVESAALGAGTDLAQSIASTNSRSHLVSGNVRNRFSQRKLKVAVDVDEG